MSRSSQRSGPTPAGDDEPEVEDVEVRTIVYDDVDGDVVEGHLLPAPQPAPSPVVAATPFAPAVAIAPPHEAAVVESSRPAVRAEIKPPTPAVAAKAPPAVAPRPAAATRSQQLAAAAADVAAAVRPAPAARTDDADRPARSTSAASPAHATPARVSDKTPTPDAAGPARRLPETSRRSSTSASSKSSSRSSTTSSRPPQDVAATTPAAASSRQSSQSSTRMDVLRRSKSAADAPVEGGVVCPFCAHVRAADAVGACPRCTMEDSPSTRRNTGERIGPWFVLQRKNPTAPGLRFHVILALVKRGHVTGRSIVRGPTTGQLWRYATEVKGLSRLFGTCWHCHGEVVADDAYCPRCKSAQEPPDDPDAFIESQAELPLMEQAARVALEETPAAVRGKPAEPTTVEPALSTALDDATIDPPTRERTRPSAGERPTPRDVASSPRATERTPAAEKRPPSKFAKAAEKKPAAGAIDPMLSATELAAVFQMPTPPRPSLARRAGRRLWKATKVGSLVVLFLATAGTVVFTAKPELREPARRRVEPLVYATRDAAIRAGAWTKEQWNVAWAAGARAIARLQETPTTLPTLPDESSAPAGVAAPANDRPATDDLPPATPIRPDPAASPAPEARREVPPGGTSITDASPAPAIASPKVESPPAASVEGEWDALMTRDDAATRTAADRTIAANPTAPLDAAPPDAIVAAAPTSRPATPEARAAQLDETADALLREADRVLAEAQAAAAAAGTTPGPGSPAPRPAPAATPKPNAGVTAPNGVTASNGVTAANGVATGQSSRTVDPSAPRPAATPGPQPAAAAPRPTSLDQAIAQAATLRQQAFEAEARRDWPAAVKLWQQIAELPEDARPSDVRVRLALAEERAKR